MHDETTPKPTTQATLTPPGRALEDELTPKAVHFLLGVRAQYLRNGANRLKAWEQLAERVRAASRRSTSVEEWATAVLRGLQIAGPTNSTSSALADLTRTVAARASADTFLRLVEREWAAMIACAQLEAERRRDAQRAGGGTADADADADADEDLPLRDEITLARHAMTITAPETAR